MILENEERRIVAYLDGLQEKVNALGELQTPSLHFGDGSQSTSGEELSAWMPSVLERTYKGEL
jgi:hypothetical protein